MYKLLEQLFSRSPDCWCSETGAFPWFMYTQTKAEDLVQRGDGGKQQRECSFCVTLPFSAAPCLRNCRPESCQAGQGLTNSSRAKLFNTLLFYLRLHEMHSSQLLRPGFCQSKLSSAFNIYIVLWGLLCWKGIFSCLLVQPAGWQLAFFKPLFCCLCSTQKYGVGCS